MNIIILNVYYERILGISHNSHRITLYSLSHFNYFRFQCREILHFFVILLLKEKYNRIPHQTTYLNNKYRYSPNAAAPPMLLLARSRTL